ncbi:MAG: Uncharacterised protein [Flavobacterium sp. SCGC AAA160-P02]|nr:MAG: Uncharacterised protein [Flavobacterium sp. SCGC AAA160-P02]
MKKLLLLFSTIILSCTQVTTGDLSGVLDDNSTEVQMTKELMEKYAEGNFREIADMISDDSGEYYFNNVKVDKEGWLSAAEGHHDLFDNIKNDSEGINLTSADYNNGTTWSMAWFQWTGKGKYTGEEVKIIVHHGFRFEDEKIVAAYHFFDPSLLDREVKAAEAMNKTSTKVLGLAELIVNKGFSSSDVEEFLSRFSKFVRETEPGTYDFGYFISSDGKRVNLVEKYYTSSDFVYHLNNFEQSEYSKEFMTLFTLDKVIIAGDASDELKAKAIAYGAELRPQVGGWIN